MSLDGYRFHAVGVDGMVTAFAKQVESVLLKVFNGLTPSDEHQ